MMKNKTINQLSARIFCALALFLCLSSDALAYDAQSAAAWMAQFAQALTELSPINDPNRTTDPARAGEYLLEYEFGTVRSTSDVNPGMDEILEIDVRTNQVTDCRGIRVGMALSSALNGSEPEYAASPLYVLSVHEDGPGWSWAYLSENGVYGVEYIAYAGTGAFMKEYTLTYVIENDMISAIRMKIAAATPAQAQDGLATAQEMASRQASLLMIKANTNPVLEFENLRIEGAKALGVPVSELIAVMGEPADIQTLPHGSGRLLVYDGAVVTLGFNEMTGEEIVRAVSVSSTDYQGPYGLRVGMALQEAGSLIRCDKDVYSRGGMLYLAGEAQGEAPYGELRVVSDDEMMLVYACDAQADTALLQAVAVEGEITGWQLMYLSDMLGGV